MRTRLLRTEAVTTRLTRADLALVEAAAASMGKTRSSAVREMLLLAARAHLLGGDLRQGSEAD